MIRRRGKNGLGFGERVRSSVHLPVADHIFAPRHLFASPTVQILASALAVRGRHRQGVSHCARKPLPALIPLRLPPKAARNRAYPRPAGKNARFMITAIRAMFSSTIGKFLALAFVALVGVARSEEHTSELQSLMRNSYVVFGLTKKKITKI